jgi:hypothetical protein
VAPTRQGLPTNFATSLPLQGEDEARDVAQCDWLHRYSLWELSDRDDGI